MSKSVVVVKEEREDTFQIANVQLNHILGRETVFFDIVYNGNTLDSRGDIIPYDGENKPATHANDYYYYLKEFVNRDDEGKPSLERAEGTRCLCIGNNEPGILALQDLFHVRRPELVPILEILDALEQILLQLPRTKS